MLHQDSHGRLLLAQEHAARLAEDYGRSGSSTVRRRANDLARLLSRRRRRRLYRQRAYSA
jgi:hypothetical protein